MNDYKERLKEELAQLEEKSIKLNSFIVDYFMGEIDVELDCPLWVLELQLNTMNAYLNVLKKRIELGDTHEV